MSDDLRDLYQEVILDHGRYPRNKRSMGECSHIAHGENPLCGDKIVVYLKLDHDKKIVDLSFEGQGCAISTASASLMTEIMIGKNEAEAQSLFDAFHAIATGEDPNTDDLVEDDLDRLQVLAGVRDYPVRVKCATLAWHTMVAALTRQSTVSTE
jgi:nitrogen fixation NifU-like protein